MARTCLREYNGERSSVLGNVMRTPDGVSDVMVYVSSLRFFAMLRFAMLPLVLGLATRRSVCRQSQHKRVDSTFDRLENVENPK